MSITDHQHVVDEPGDAIRPEDLDVDPRDDIEALCLCALLWAPAETARGAVAILDAADFHRPIYAELYEVIAALVREGAPHGTAMVGAALEQGGKLAGHHGALLSRALADTTTAGADAISVGYYAKAVIALAYRRGYHQAATGLAQAAEELPEDELFEYLLAVGRERRTAHRRLEAIRAAQI